MIGWADPEECKSNKISKWLKSLSHNKFMYDQEVFSSTKPPNIIFVPDEALMNKLIENVATHTEDTDTLLIKFCDFLPPKPQWMVDIEEAREAERIRMAGNADESIL